MYIVVEHEEGRIAKVISQHKDITSANKSMIKQLEKKLDEDGISILEECWDEDGNYVDELDEVFIVPNKYVGYFDGSYGLNYWLFILEVKED